MSLVKFTIFDNFLISKGYLRSDSGHSTDRCRLCPGLDNKYRTGPLCAKHNTSENAYRELIAAFGPGSVGNNLCDSQKLTRHQQRRRRRQRRQHMPLNRYEQEVPNSNSDDSNEQPYKCEVHMPMNRFEQEVPNNNSDASNEQPSNRYEEDIPKNKDQPYKCEVCSQIVWIEEMNGHQSRYHPDISLDVNIFHHDDAEPSQ